MAKSGAPTRAERREQQMTDAFSTMSEAMKAQAETAQAQAAAIAKLEKKLEGEAGKEQSRTLDPVEEFRAAVGPTPTGEPPVIYKSGTRGLMQMVKASYIIQRSANNPQIVPAVFAEFENGTYRVSDPEFIKMLDDAMERRAKQGLPARIVKLKDEAAEKLADKNGDVKAIPSDRATMDAGNEDYRTAGISPEPLI